LGLGYYGLKEDGMGIWIFQVPAFPHSFSPNGASSYKEVGCVSPAVWDASCFLLKIALCTVGRTIWRSSWEYYKMSGESNYVQEESREALAMASIDGMVQVTVRFLA
jgi:hypothetical protein